MNYSKLFGFKDPQIRVRQVVWEGSPQVRGSGGFRGSHR